MLALAVAAVVGAVIVVGLGAVLAVFPAGTISLATRLAAVFGLGCAVTLSASVVLVLAGLLAALPLALLLGTITAACFVVGMRRSTARDHLIALRAELLEGGPFLWVGLGVLVVVGVAWAAIPVLPLHGALRYWADGLELADTGAVPDFTAQWGDALPPAVSKLGANSFVGSLSLVFLDRPFAGMAAALWLAVVGYSAGLLALGRELGLLRTAPVLPLLALTSVSLPGDVVLNAGRASAKLASYQHEDLGRMLAVVGAAIVLAKGADRAPVQRLLAGGLVIASAALTHLIPVIAFGALVGGIALAQIAMGPARARLAAAAVGAAAIAAFLASLALFLAGGDIGLQGAERPQEYVLLDGRYDPTAAVNGLRRLPRAKSESRWYEPPGMTARLALEAAIGRGLTSRNAFVLVLIALVAGVVVLALGSRELRLLVVGSAVMAFVLLAVALLFSYRYGFYAQATFGKRRLFEYMPIPIMLLSCALVEAVASRFGVRWSSAGRLVALAFFLAVLVFSVGDLGTTRSNLRGATRYIQAAVGTPCDSRLLVDRVTRGAFQALTGRISVTEGLAPFLRPAIVNDVIRVRAGASRFFAEPKRFSSILREQEVDFVVASGSRRLRALDGLRLVRDVDGIEVYEVQVPATTGDRPTPVESAGYHCFLEVPY